MSSSTVQQSSAPTQRSRNGILSGVKKHALAVLLFAFFLYIHATGLYLFTRGFLLTRLTLDTISSSSSLTPAPTYQKAVFIIIDALRFDFISPSPPQPNKPNHHHVLTLPYELTTSQPSNSFIFHAYSDPPTTTLQRLKGLTTGSLPTFIDAGSNFAGQEIFEDSIIGQMKAQGRKLGFMGDDTWLSLFPASFDKNMSHPFDSFNVEDLHSVDNGVIEHLMPLLEPERQGEWDFLIGHFLGVDHVGHRLGPDHINMKLKLKQMDDVLRKIVDKLEDDTLLVVLGDHGMDPKGDHGGDGELETSSALWVYSKGIPFSTDSISSIVGDESSSNPNFYSFPSTTSLFRSVQQIDLVPTLSILLGVPIPFNNLGTIIPELFTTASSDGAGLDNAIKLNAQQIWDYMGAYKEISGGKEIEKAMRDVSQQWSGLQKATGREAPIKDASEESLTGRVISTIFGGGSSSGDTISAQEAAQSFRDFSSFTRSALSHCRSLWAQFNITDMGLGICILLLSIPTLLVVYLHVGSHRILWEDWVQRHLGYALLGGVGGAVIGSVSAALAVELGSKLYIHPLDAAIYMSGLTSQIVFLLPSALPAWRVIRQNISTQSIMVLIGPILLILHTIGFSTNSFILLEDRISLYFVGTIGLLFIIRGPAALTPHLRLRMMLYGLLFLACLRISGLSTVCREENAAFCHVTFYEGASVPVPPTIVLLLCLPVAFLLPSVINAFLAISKSNIGGLAPFYTNYLWRGLLIGGTFYWLFERAETWGEINPDRIPLIKMLKTWLARGVMIIAVTAGYYIWYIAPLCIEVRQGGSDESKDLVEDDGMGTAKPTTKNQVIVLGFANSYGSSYVLFLLPFFALLHLVTQPSGQLVLALTITSVFTLLEIIDSQRDTISLTAAFNANTPETIASFDPTSATAGSVIAPTFTEAATLALVSHLVFFTSGHQAVLSSIQWKAAFVGFNNVTYPFSPVLVVLNTWGPMFLITLTVPLLALWNISPRPRGYVPVLADSVKAGLAYILYHSTITVSAAVWAGYFRRHLMVWKVFAPRFMLGAVSLLMVDFGLILAIGVGVKVVTGKVHAVFKTIV